MTSIGDTLRQERQRRNLEVSKIAGELKIATRFLEAIEQDDFAKLPGGVFTRSFVRQYANFLGLDGEEMVAGMERAVEPDPEASQLTYHPKPDVPGMELNTGNDWRSIDGHRTALPSWIRAGALLVVLIAVCSGVYWWWQRPRHPAQAHELPPAPKAVPVPRSTPPVQQTAEIPHREASPSDASPSTVEAASAQPKATPVSAEQPVLTPAAAIPAVPAPAPNPNATVRVAITADEEVWVRADVNGKYQFSGTLKPHESRNIDADGEVTLRLGNAGGATLTWNGKPVGPAGPRGQPRTVQFTSGGFQIVSPPKVLDPLDRL